MQMQLIEMMFLKTKLTSYVANELLKNFPIDGNRLN